MKMELRSNSVTLASDSEGLIVRGYVNKPGQLSQLLGSGRKFKETISPGAFAAAIENRSNEIEFLAEHNKERVLASTKNDSLILREDENGLYMEARVAPTTYGKDYYTLISEGLIGAMSFGFRAIKDSWKHVEGVAIRTVEQLELFEVSAVKNPAYLQSTISARNIELVEKIEVPTEEQIKEERGNLDMMILEERTTNEFEQMLRGEVRELNGTADGGALIPENVHNEIVVKMEETSPVFAKARKLNSVAGTLRVAREDDAIEAGFVGEGSDVIQGKVGFEYVELKQKRVGAALTLSNQMINETAINIQDYSKDLLARRISKVVERSLLVGTGGDEFNGIIHDTDIAKVEVTGTVTYDDLLELFLTLHPDYLNGASFIMSRTFFNQVSKLKDNNGHFYMQNGIVNGKLTYTLFGAAVDVTESLPDTTPVLFGNVERAVSVLIKQEAGLQEIVDSKLALKGAKMFLYDMYMDAAVVDSQAMAKLVVQ